MGNGYIIVFLVNPWTILAALSVKNWLIRSSNLPSSQFRDKTVYSFENTKEFLEIEDNYLCLRIKYNHAQHYFNLSIIFGLMEYTFLTLIIEITITIYSFIYFVYYVKTICSLFLIRFIFQESYLNHGNYNEQLDLKHNEP